MEKETRFIPGTVVEERAESGETFISGAGVVFDAWSADLGGFKERILPTAFDGVDTSDVFITFNHNFDNVLARTKNGSATLDTSPAGIQYRYKTPETSTGKDVQQLISDGIVEGSSFMFTVAPDGDKWEKMDDGTYERTITQIGRLFEMGPVTVPAYPDTTATLARGMDSIEVVDNRAAFELAKSKHRHLQTKLQG